MRTTVLRLVLVSACVSGCAPSPSLEAPAQRALSRDLLTTAEETGFARTTSHADVVRLLDAIAAASPTARRVSMGTSKEGRDLPVIVIADPPVGTPAEAREAARQGRPTVLLFANIHAGEVDPKEALIMLARELASGAHPDVTKKLVVAMAPIYNADGNERLGPEATHRPGQNGPDPVGTRENADGLDLNRDFIKLEAPESRALVRFMNEWDPAVVLDGHTTNGSHHRYLVTTAGPKSPATDAGLLRFWRDRYIARVMQGFERTTGGPAFWYGNFEGEFEGKPGWTRWETFPAEGRFGTTYIGLRGRISVLLESYSYATFRDRVLGSRAFALETLRAAAEMRGEIRDVLARADAEPIVGQSIAIASKAASLGTVVVKGFEEPSTQSGANGLRGTPKDHAVELWDQFEATHTVIAPRAYALLSPSENVVDVLRGHGVRTERLAAGRTIKGERLRVTSAASASRLFQGHALVRVSVSAELGDISLPAETLLVPTDQPLGRLVVYLLEPACEDGLTTWNFFDDSLTIGQLMPIVRVRE